MVWMTSLHSGGVNHLSVVHSQTAAGPISLAQPRCAFLTLFTFPVGAEGLAWLSEHLQGKAKCAKWSGVETPVLQLPFCLADCPGFAGLENSLSFGSLARLKGFLGKTLGRSGA